MLCQHPWFLVYYTLISLATEAADKTTGFQAL